MKALCITKVGGMEALSIEDLPKPVISDPMDIIVKVRNSAMNRLDLFQRAGSHASAPAVFPYIPGKEFSGDVVEVGSAVTRFKPGDPVMGTGNHFHAEYALVRPNVGIHQEAVEIIPPGVSYEEASAIPISFSMAWRMLHTDGKIRTAENVLIMGAGSGTGSCGIQLAKIAGARVITTAGTDGKLEKAKAWGADEIINYKDVAKFSKRVLELTNGDGVDMIFEHIGTPVWEECFASLKHHGRLVTCGVTGGHRVSLHLGQMWRRELSVIGSTNHPELDLKTIAVLAGRGLIRGVVDSVFTMEEGAASHERMEAGDFFGKIVMKIA
jgi:NADPH:quinone reductase-like Zn-dependent oxidoreductase